MGNAQHAHHIVVVLRRRRGLAGNPIEQIGVGAIEQGLEPVQLRDAEAAERAIGEVAENQVDFLRAAMPAKILQPLAALILNMAFAP
jgi:hypothetical protein